MIRTSYYFVLILGLICLMLLSGCSRSSEILRIGIIKPSIDHLPLSYAMKMGKLNPKQIQAVYFSSGWEVQEALVSGKVDVAIVPFTYAWNAASKGYPLRIVSFFERETDAILVPHTHEETTLAPNSKIGLLKASTLDILFYDWAMNRNLPYESVFFRTPNELVEAGKTGAVNAIVAYVPIIQKTSQDYKVLDWFANDYPWHPCCDLVVNTSKLSPQSKRLISSMMDVLNDTISEISRPTPELLAFMAESYGLSPAECRTALKHTVFSMGLDEKGKSFERNMISHALDMGYQDRQLEDDEIYLELGE